MGKIIDERIIAGKRKINSSAFGICFLALWGILLYRQFMLHQDIREYADIFLLTIGISIYVVVSNILQGFYYTYRSRRTQKKNHTNRCIDRDYSVFNSSDTDNGL